MNGVLKVFIRLGLEMSQRFQRDFVHGVLREFALARKTTESVPDLAPKMFVPAISAAAVHGHLW